MAKFSATEKKYIIKCIEDTMKTKFNELQNTFSDPDGYFTKGRYGGVSYTEAYAQATHDAVAQKAYVVRVKASGALDVTIPHLNKKEEAFVAAYDKIRDKYKATQAAATHTVMLGSNLEEAKDILATLQQL